MASFAVIHYGQAVVRDTKPDCVTYTGRDQATLNILDAVVKA